MKPLTDFNKFWLEQDGKKVKLDGFAHVIKVTVINASYPYPHEAIDVSAEPINKNSKYYRDIRHKLGDDWSTDVLDSDPEVEAGIRQQLVG